MVADNYEKLRGELAGQRKHVKAAAQRLIDVLASRVRASDETPEKYKLKLLHDDYSNIRILGKTGRDEEIIAVVKGKSGAEK